MVAGRLDALRRVAAAVATPLVPLKGIELAFSYYRSPTERPMSDVDVLVTGDFRATIRALAEAGFATRGAGWSAHAVTPPSSSFEVDVHRIALPPAMGALRTSVIVRESRRDTATYGVPVLRPCPEHLLLHLCGNCVKDRLVARDTFAKDVAAVVPHVDPKRFARLAREARLSGTAYLALDLGGELALDGTGASAQPLLDALALTAARRKSLRGLRRAIEGMKSSPELSYALARASCDGFVLPATSVLLSLARAVRDRVRGTPSWMS